MDNDTHIGPEESAVHSISRIGGGTCNAATVNTCARDINMIGCTTTSNFTLMTASTAPSDIRIISLADIDLQYEIRVNHNTGVVSRHERTCVRRVYSARVEGRSTTVATYQGNSAEKRTSVAFPLQHLIWPKSADFTAASNYSSSTLGQYLDWDECTFWIRHSTGRLCVERMVPTHRIWLTTASQMSDMQGIYSLSASNTEANAIESLTLYQYHYTCFWNLAQDRTITGSPPTAVKLGAVICCSSGNRLEDSDEIAFLPNLETFSGCWTNTKGPAGEKMEDGWIRYQLEHVLKSEIRLYIRSDDSAPWLSQANHIFSRLHLASNLEDYVLVDHVKFRLNVSATTENLPVGFLFLCPEHDFKIGPSLFTWPDCPAYWSLDPSGAERLSMDEATRLGFPHIECTAKVFGNFWETSVYTGLRQFYQGKGFDPDSQVVALHLKHPLFKLSKEIDPPFAYIDNAEDDQGPVNTDNKQRPSTNSCGAAQVPEHWILREEIPVMQTLNFLLIVQLMLMIFHTFSWLYVRFPSYGAKLSSRRLIVSCLFAPPAMDDDPHATTDFNSNATSHYPESAPYGGPSFSGSQQFTVTGGAFTSITKKYISTPTVPPLGDFQTISIGISTCRMKYATSTALAPSIANTDGLVSGEYILPESRAELRV
ncbi:hypothetical protein MVEN_01121500 [Mycena venus]|uniref:Uncharacterized protein n=1 Tax=Mycena venus TaxID=2733690 RepID=A0A8H6Y8Y2_9AGAR|nr:hypothetical protein MVEN_01121500 [Mycena venus]